MTVKFGAWRRKNRVQKSFECTWNVKSCHVYAIRCLNIFRLWKGREIGEISVNGFMQKSAEWMSSSNNKLRRWLTMFLMCSHITQIFHSTFYLRDNRVALASLLLASSHFHSRFSNSPTHNITMCCFATRDPLHVEEFRLAKCSALEKTTFSLFSAPLPCLSIRKFIFSAYFFVVWESNQNLFGVGSR